MIAGPDNFPPPPTAWNAPPVYAFERGRQFAIEPDFAPYLEGLAGLPNFEEMPVVEVTGILISLHGKIVHRCYVRTAPVPVRSFSSAMYGLVMTQGGGFTGEGYVIWRGGWRSDDQVKAGRFALCKHKRVEGPGANHSRGWHPGYCSICGLDMSVDSGD